jgi:hypothetical protein
MKRWRRRKRKKAGGNKQYRIFSKNPESHGGLEI